MQKVGDVVDAVMFGETMIAMNPLEVGDLADVSRFEKRMAGSESNVAIGLARLGHRVAWVSRVGDDGFGRYIKQAIAREGVDVSHVSTTSIHPTGVYFKELDEYGKTSVYYYRKHSAASTLSPSDVATELLESARYVFVSGITPALSQACRDTVFDVLERANRAAVPVVFDPNVRLKLWTPDEARPVLMQMAERSEVVLPGLEEGRLMTGESTETAITEKLMRGRTRLVVIKLGARGAYYRTPSSSGYVEGFTVRQIDEIGAGDAFAAGCVSGLLDGLDVPGAVRRACALGALAVTAKGDFEALPTRSQLETFLTEQTAAQ